MPSNAGGGAHSIQAQCLDASGNLISAAFTFDVTRTLTLTPTSGYNFAGIAGSGLGYDNCNSIAVEWDSTGQITAGTVDQDVAIFQIPIPGGSPPGVYSVTSLCDGQTAVTSTYTILPPPPTSTTTTQAPYQPAPAEPAAATRPSTTTPTQTEAPRSSTTTPPGSTTTAATVPPLSEPIPKTQAALNATSKSPKTTNPAWIIVLVLVLVLGAIAAVTAAIIRRRRQQRSP